MVKVAHRFCTPLPWPVYFLIVVDAYSNWLEVETMTTSTACISIKNSERTFAMHGIHDIIASDNGATFTSADFRTFCKAMALNKSTPYLTIRHPINGLDQRTVATFKAVMKRMLSEYGSLESKN